MTEVKETKAPKGAPTGLAAVSPLASTLAVAVGWGVNFFLNGLLARTLAQNFPAHFPTAGPEGETPHPTETGLLLTTLAMALNGTIAGLFVGRLAPVAPVVHAAILAGLFGMFAMTGMDQARGLPGWFALAFALVPPATCVLGGFLSGRLRARQAAAARPRGAAEAIPTEPKGP